LSTLRLTKFLIKEFYYYYYYYYYYHMHSARIAQRKRAISQSTMKNMTCVTETRDVQARI